MEQLLYTQCFSLTSGVGAFSISRISFPILPLSWILCMASFTCKTKHVKFQGLVTQKPEFYIHTKVTAILHDAQVVHQRKMRRTRQEIVLPSCDFINCSCSSLGQNRDLSIFSLKNQRETSAKIVNSSVFKALTGDLGGFKYLLQIRQNMDLKPGLLQPRQVS